MSLYFGPSLYSGSGVYFGAPLVDAEGNQAPTLQNLTVSVSEALPVGSVVGYLSAGDSDGDFLLFSLAGLTSNEFRVNALTGEIRLNTALNYDQQSQYVFTAITSDGETTASATVTVNVTEVVIPAPSIDALIGRLRVHPAGSEINAAATIYRNNTNIIELQELRFAISREFSSSATVQITLKDLDGQTLTGATFPVTLQAFDNGLYYGTIPHTLSLDDEEEIVAEVSATSGQSVGFWTENITVINREA